MVNRRYKLRKLPPGNLFSRGELMVFYCKDCGNEFEINDKECEGYYNWKCPECQHIANKKDSSGLGVIWKCDTGTVSRNAGSTPASSPCASCPNAS